MSKETRNRKNRLQEKFRAGGGYLKCDLEFLERQKCRLRPAPSPLWRTSARWMRKRSGWHPAGRMQELP